MSNPVPAPGAQEPVFAGFVTFAAGASADTVQTLAVPLPEHGRRSRAGTYLLTAWSDSYLDAGYEVAVSNRIPLQTSSMARSDQMVPLGGNPLLNLAAGAAASVATTGWLVGASPAQVQITLTAAASATGGRVWVVVHAIGERD